MPRGVLRWATFDCYGTLVDWNGGLRDALARVWPRAEPDRLLRRYHELEPEVERAHPASSYREVMRRCLRGVADGEGLALAAADEDALAGSLPGWLPFADAPGALAELRRRGWRLGVLSNTDPDLIAASIRRLAVPIDEVVTAADAGSYKPEPGHWRVFFERAGAAPARHVHVAQSLFHDVVPARRLGLACVWVNRLGEALPSGVPAPTRELPDLSALPGVLDELVPGS